jgi:pilus assembly protein CpaF
VDALDRIYDDVDAALLAENVSPQDRDSVRRVAARVVGEHMTMADRGIVAPLADPDGTVGEIVADICDFGVLGTLFAMEGVEDITVEGEQISYFADGRWKVPNAPTTERRNRHVIDQLLAQAGVALDQTHPSVDGVQVLDGRGRLAADIPPVSPMLSVTIRLKVERSMTLEELVEREMLSGPCADLLALVIRARGAFIVSGEAGSGKTTLLSALIGEADPGHVVRVVEEYREIDFAHNLGNTYQTVPGPDDGQHVRTIAGLVRHMLRTRPDLVIVGEIRGPEAWDLARAAGVGAGCAATVHAPDASRGLEALVLLGRGHEQHPEPDVIRETFSHLLHFVIHCERGVGADGAYVHQVTEVRAIYPPVDPKRMFTSEVIFDRPDGLGSPMAWTKLAPPEPVVERLERHLSGSDLRTLLAGES